MVWTKEKAKEYNKKYYKENISKNLTRLTAAIPNETVEKFKFKLAEDRIAYRRWLMIKINDYINGRDK